MATSRDDFVIAIRSAFLKKGNKQRFSLIGLIFFSIGLIFLSRINLPALNLLKISLNEIVYRSSFIVSIPEKKSQEAIKIIKDHYLLYSEFKDTKKKLIELQSEKHETKFIISENQRLKKIIDEYVVDSKKVVAKVLIDKKSPFLRSIILNRGTRDNIELGMAVLDGAYLVGKIVEVNYVTSRGLLISDLNSKIPVTIEPGNIQSILSGTGKEKGIIEYLKNKSTLENHNVVYTSGSGGLLKAGIPIGVIEKPNLSEANKVSFFSDLSQLTFVELISYKKVID